MNIFKVFSRILLFSAALTFSTLVSCEEIETGAWERPDEMSPYVTDDCVTFTGSWGMSGNGIVSFNLKPTVFADFDYWQLKIRSIDYYIDEVLIKNATNEPFSFDYTVPGLSAGRHQLVAKVKIEDLVNHDELEIFPTKDFEVNSYPDLSNGLMYTVSRYRSGNKYYFNVSRVSILSSLADSGWTLTSVSFYFDNELINTVYDEPFGISYTTKDLNKGKHYFSIKGTIVDVSNAQEMELVQKIEIDMP